MLKEILLATRYIYRGMFFGFGATIGLAAAINLMNEKSPQSPDFSRGEQSTIGLGAGNDG